MQVYSCILKPGVGLHASCRTSAGGCRTAIVLRGKHHSPESCIFQESSKLQTCHSMLGSSCPLSISSQPLEDFTVLQNYIRLQI